ncbi:glutamyl-tRNA amidotransferase [Methanocalculus chunghsingensis]|uniref:Glutamyl-tRNA(Gln) amidotransferase subunit D n=1 Tax=Methanocalculus chunghsingensis TaxID=156457 RepID=A0A8J7W5H2_9EURY|nr:Glu-tRNA(Gln) amidotransferase subunit GatD [Methanocalculus chunghsingensis]MBR1368061.1 glutamyl-tRNA amidotransferase [Methanocalculus chunghsingensis]
MKAGDRVLCSPGREETEGIFIAEREGMAVVKLKSGYNIGVTASDIQFIGAGDQNRVSPPDVIQNPNLPLFSIISTGGTIASRVDYRTGAVTSQSNAEEIIRAIPRLGALGQYRTRQPFTTLSENIQPSMWMDLARAVYEEITNGARGVIVTHGTDTMAYSASALSFMLTTPVPVIFVGSQRSADRPSSDNIMNMLCSVAAAGADLGEVAVCMHATANDDICAIHRATRVRKMHTSRRDAFQSIGIPPIATVTYPNLLVSTDRDAIRRASNEASLADRLEERCSLISFHPGMSPAILEGYRSCRGIIITGTGLGHTSTELIGIIRELIEDGTTVVMTTQCLRGRVCDRVYDTGRDLMAAGVIEGEDMLPETALVKLMWVLGQTDEPDEIKRMMQANLKGEINRRSAHGL